LFCRAAKNLYLPTNPRNENLWNLTTKTTQIDCILFRRTAKSCGFATKSIVFCSAAQRKLSEFRTKALHFVQPQRNFLFANKIKSTGFYSAAQRHIFELRTKALYFVQPQRKTFKLRTKVLYFVHPRSENFAIVNKKSVFCLAAQ
jgi:hypothetical protein